MCLWPEQVWLSRRCWKTFCVSVRFNSPTSAISSVEAQPQISICSILTLTSHYCSLRARHFIGTEETRNASPMKDIGKPTIYLEPTGQYQANLASSIFTATISLATLNEFWQDRVKGPQGKVAPGHRSHGLSPPGFFFLFHLALANNLWVPWDIWGHVLNFTMSYFLLTLL